MKLSNEIVPVAAQACPTCGSITASPGLVTLELDGKRTLCTDDFHVGREDFSPMFVQDGADLVGA